MNTALHEIARLKRDLAMLRPPAVAKRAAQTVERLEELEKSGDPEAARCEGDKLISDFLRAAGHADLANAFDAARENWWYG